MIENQYYAIRWSQNTCVLIRSGSMKRMQANKNSLRLGLNSNLCSVAIILFFFKKLF